MEKGLHDRMHREMLRIIKHMEIWTQLDAEFTLGAAGRVKRVLAATFLMGYNTGTGNRRATKKELADLEHYRTLIIKAFNLLEIKSVS